MKTLTWHVAGRTFQCAIEPKPCPVCLHCAVTALPEPIRKEQTDGTTHVCHPSIGGCNQGFEVSK